MSKMTSYSEVEEARSKVRLEWSKARSQDLDRSVIHRTVTVCLVLFRLTITVSLVLLGLTITVSLVLLGWSIMVCCLVLFWWTVTVPDGTVWYLMDNVLVYIDNITLRPQKKERERERETREKRAKECAKKGLSYKWASKAAHPSLCLVQKI